MPVLSTPVLFNTAAADVILSAMQIMPVTNPWNEDISQPPRLANSDAMIAQIKSDLSPTRQTLRAFYEMNFVLVPDNQPRIAIPFLDYPDESDLDGGTFPNGNYPIPSRIICHKRCYRFHRMVSGSAALLGYANFRRLRCEYV